MTVTEKKKYIRSLIIAASIVAGVLVLDLVSKTLTDYKEIVLIPEFLIIQYAHNYNAAFSFSFWMPPDVFKVVVTVLTFIAIAVILFLLIWIKKKHTLFTVSMSMILTGAAGNLIDRLVFGYVRDFIQIKYFGLEIFGSMSFAIFNVADISLVCGVIVMLVWVIFFFMRSGNDKATPMDPALVTEGPAKMPEKKEFKPISRPEPEPDKDGKEENNAEPEDKNGGDKEQ